MTAKQRTPELPELPPELAGWRWSATPTGNVTLAHPAEAFVTRLYSKPERAIDEARRWLTSQPKPKPASEAPIRRGAPLTLSTSEQPPAGEGLTLVALGSIHDNPYQPRLAYDDERIAAIAASIREHGLLQAPVARPFGEGYELAFGHSRFRAYQHLAAEDPARFGRMPLAVRALDDETMALHAWIENKDRKDLTAFEEAKAIERYTTQFGWTQAKAAEKLQLDRSTVANKLRLLRLPQQALDQLQAGALSERQAAALLPLMDLPEDARAARVGYFYIDGNVSVENVNDLIAKAGQLDSGKLRATVDRMLDNQTVTLDKRPWVAVPLEGELIRSPTCKECPLRLKSTNRCPDKACAGAKVIAHRAKMAAAASAAVGLPTTGYTGYSDRNTLSGVNLEALRKIADEKQCGRLAVVYDEQLRHSEHPVEGHEHCAIVCGHGPNKRCGCLQTLVNRADPTAGREAQKKHERKRIEAEINPPAIAALAKAFETPTAELWRWLFCKLHWTAERNVPKNADRAAILTAFAAAIVNSTTEYSSEAAYAEKGLIELFAKLGLPSPFLWDVPTVAEVTPPADPVAAVRSHLEQARQFAGIGMAHYYLGEARAAFDRAVGVVLTPATLEALTREINQVADTIAKAEAGDFDATTPTPPDVGAQTLAAQIAAAVNGDTPVGFAQLQAWAAALQAQWDAGHAGPGDETTIEQLAELQQLLVDDVTIDDAAFEALTMQLDTMAERLAEMGARHAA